MPVAPARPCLRPGCHELRPCPVHGAGSETHAERVAATPWRSLYGTQRWRRLRARVRLQEPLCQACLADGRPPRPSHHVDHITPHRGDVRLFYDRLNLQALCAPCHSKKTRREQLA